MLVLTRKRGEKIVIKVDAEDPSKDIVIQLAQISRAQVRIGIDAPREFKIYRMDENEKA